MKPIGKILKSKRESLGMTLLDMEQRIRIQRQYITMIENNDFESLPNPDYAVGFVKKYADSVNLNGDKLIEEHQAELPTSKISAREAKKALKTHTAQDTEVVLPLIKLIALVTVLCTIVWLFAVYLFPAEEKWEAESINPSRNIASKSETTTKPVAKNKEQTKEPAATTVNYHSFDGTVLNYDVKTNEPVSIRIKSSVPAWIQLDDDQKKSYTFQNVTDRTVKINKNVKTFRLMSGNDPSLTVTLNGQKVDVPKDAEQLITRTYQFNIMKEKGA
ncbi:helix-turn-helix domain-containing protein [Macrococcus hajekii]|uniref:Helix-turn-helix domain-containing protein n=1 Tax=Macrococcus hajekii TaxID=198482 RepID=A0A4R6BMR9_9STAP|nr:helix-turn-helix domain-containing protein [Macrococcus hajekii]TDM03139.1 helix-turn-helix domain-containing protein [Macrococcus hajekii]GGA96282.1 hypothetical protein GCM10007190_00410 [Macrococcus hajekii]